MTKTVKIYTDHLEYNRLYNTLQNKVSLLTKDSDSCQLSEAATSLAFTGSDIGLLKCAVKKKKKKWKSQTVIYNNKDISLPVNKCNILKRPVEADLQDLAGRDVYLWRYATQTQSSEVW